MAINNKYLYLLMACTWLLASCDSGANGNESKLANAGDKATVSTTSQSAEPADMMLAKADEPKAASAAKQTTKAQSPSAPLTLAPLGDAPIPSDNKQTDAKIELGKLLFFDPRLGGDASVSCASCHSPESGWGFAEDLSRGYPGTVHWRNSQTVVNSLITPNCSGQLLYRLWKPRPLQPLKVVSRAMVKMI